ncbi:hypothetical protein CDAR_264781 [Caerostris darwini]|uniref:Cytochrome c biogenesis B n=1 Tax=Caerostris darwini TaxID=1538125 RepID=A0AAV4NKQ5_9ARAC|nr:hypothetical protein CDAR_264781 [Caerostris darwini]
MKYKGGRIKVPNFGNKKDFTAVEQSGIDYIQSLLIWINQELIASNLFSSGSIRKPFHPISSPLEQSNISLIQSLLIWIPPEWISSNLVPSGLISNRSHPMSFQLDIMSRSHPISFRLAHQKSISFNLFPSGTIRN